MVSASLKTGKVVQSKKKEENVAFGQKKTKTKSSKRQISVPAVKKAVELSNFKALAAENLIRDKGAWSIGSGTFGTCYLGTYRGISVVIKEYQDRSSARDSDHNLSLLRREARHEAHVLQQLGIIRAFRFCSAFCLRRNQSA